MRELPWRSQQMATIRVPSVTPGTVMATSTAPPWAMALAAPAEAAMSYRAMGL